MGDIEYFDDGSFNVYGDDGSWTTFDSSGNVYQDDGWTGGQFGDSDNPVSDPGADPGYDPGDLPPDGTDDQTGRPTGGGSTTGAPAGGTNPLGAIQNWLNSLGGTKAAGTGALIGGLLGSGAFSGNAAPAQPRFNMAQMRNPAPRETTFGMGPARTVETPSGGLGQAQPDPNLLQNLSAPRMADGGSTHYTFGRAVDPMQNLLPVQQPPGMKSGGLPAVSDVPLAAGRLDFREGSAVHGPGDGQSDDIPAMLADGEYVIDAETVAQIGNGSTKAGAKALDEFRMNIRKHKRSAPLDKIPPKTKTLTSYLKKGD